MNYIDYMKKHYERLYADIIYPAIYDKKYEEPVQLDIEDSDELDSSKDIVNQANDEKQQSTRFTTGNKEGVRFAPNKHKNEMSLETNPDDEI